MGFVSKRKNVRVPRERRLEGREREREKERRGRVDREIPNPLAGRE